jgi:hypothetical protein
MHDLLADVDRPFEELEGEVHDLDGAIHTGAEPARFGKQQPFRPNRGSELTRIFERNRRHRGRWRSACSSLEIGFVLSHFATLLLILKDLLASFLKFFCAHFAAIGGGSMPPFVAPSAHLQPVPSQ